MIRQLGHLSALEPEILAEPGCVSFTWTHDAHYLSDAASLQLYVLVYVNTADICTIISETPLEATAIQDLNALEQIARNTGNSIINLRKPLPLTPVHIAKPWGQEIWYSGIEARGVSEIEGVPIAWLLDIFGEYIGCKGAPLLLKILDPLATENLGDLYFEMHEEKIEVYVVTSIDPEAWPDGEGAIRYGFNPAKVSEYASRDEFLKAYVAQVTEYQACRRDIDERQREGTSYAEHLQSLPQEVVAKERQLRDRMYTFTELKPLRNGDVVTVRPLVPHSLQHGVRVVEFQTPHYERFILSFGQKVLTQDHWDTEQVFEKANTDAVTFDQPIALGSDEDLIADFAEFRVVRRRLSAGSSVSLTSDRYTMVMGVQGTIEISGRRMDPETAFMIPSDLPITLSNQTELSAIFLIAEEA